MADEGRPEDAVVWHAMSASEAAGKLASDLAAGLSEPEAARRRAEHGPNRLSPEPKRSFWRKYLHELREPLILLLAVTGALYAVWGEGVEAAAIFVIILLLNTIEVANEMRAGRAIAGLSRLAEPTALVRRAGRVREIHFEEVVPGDLLLLRAGRRVPADVRLVECFGLAVDESSLTGESMPVDKDPVGTVSADAPLAERVDMAWSGTLVAQGHGTGLVTATGVSTELGRVAQLARSARPPRTPLQKAMRELSGALVWPALGFSVLVPVLGYLVARLPFKDMLLTGLSLAFAMIPEEMPIIITMVLALGAVRLARNRAVVRRLDAVETLGCITVIASDKTGTLTRNSMHLAAVHPQERRLRVLEVACLCSDLLREGEAVIGSPLEAALDAAAREAGIEPRALQEAHPLLRVFPFDNGRKLMSVARIDRAYVKGAPESVIALCDGLSDPEREALLERARRMAGGGQRVIALAEGAIPASFAAGAPTREQAESRLSLVGLAGLEDPARPEAAGAIAECQSAGIRTVMITGDHPATARAVATATGLDGNGPMLTGRELEAMDEQALERSVGLVSLFARTTPGHKLRIVRALQRRGERVSVTGDGVNDAPALAAADIGIAMGASGSDMARETAGLVLTDDSFATIAAAVREGRILFANLSKGVRYYLSCKAGLLLAVLLPVFFGLPLPFTPLQLILMELFMDLAAAAGFSLEKGERDVMARPPRDPRARFMDRAMVGGILSSAAGLFAAVSLPFLYLLSRGRGVEAARTAAFSAWLVAHVLLAFVQRSGREPLARFGLLGNRLMVGWALAAGAFVAAAVALPGLRVVLGTVPLAPREWLVVAAAAFVGTFWQELPKLAALLGPRRARPA